MKKLKDGRFEVIIIGAGPAGLSASIYALRSRLNTLVVESPYIVSQVSYADNIENYPGFPEGISGIGLINNFRKQASRLGVQFKAEEVKTLKIQDEESRPVLQVITDYGSYEALSAIIASGAKAKEAGLKGEREFRGKGVSYCAVCDGIFFKDKDVVVVGDNNIAAEEAIYLSRFCKKVLFMPQSDKLHVTEIFKEKVQTNNRIEVMLNRMIREIVGKDKVNAVKAEDKNTGQLKEIPCEGVLIFTGLEPCTDFVNGIVALDERGYIITDEKMQTSQNAIFACGDCRRTSLRQVLTACADGATAAYFCQRYLK
jgi:thioredoxin reductase (NADPH)